MVEKPIVLLPIIAAIGFIVRFAYFPFDIPITLDGSGYFWYAIDMSILGHFPENHRFPNNAWPTFLSIFFSIFHFSNFMEYMYLQRLITIVLSVLTIIPVYFLCLRFFEKKIAILCSALFVLEPKIVTNSLLGITEPLFIMLGTISLSLFFSERKGMVYTAFVVLGLYTLVRYEGLLLIIPFSIMFLVRFRWENKVVLKYLVALSLFAITILPMSYVRIETTGNDGVLSHVSAGPQYYQHVVKHSDAPPDKVIIDFFASGIKNLIMYLGWSTIPVFILFVPLGIYAVFKNRDFKNSTTIFCLFVLLLPAFYAYSRDIQETRYLFIIYPILCIFSGHTLKVLFKKFKKEKLITVVLVGAILTSSLIFMELKKTDYQHEREAYNIAKEMVKRTKIINHSYAAEFTIAETKYYRSANIAFLDKFPVLSTTVENIQFVETKDHNTLEEYLEFGRKNGLEYLIIDDNSRQPDFLKDVFRNEHDYPFLNKEFDSHDHNYNYHVKIFKINYDNLKSKSFQGNE